MLLKRAFVLLVFSVAASTLAAAPQKVQDIRKNPTQFNNEEVTVEGIATQWIESSARSTAFYFLKDDWGGLIKVRTTGEKPETNKRYRITGPVGLDPKDRNDIYISEEKRVSVGGPPPAAAPLGKTDVTPTEKALTQVETSEAETSGFREKWMWPLVVATIVVLFVMFGLLLKLLRGKPAEFGTDADDSLGDEPQPQVLEGRTIKMHAPPPGTLKLLPGRLEIAGEEDGVKEIRFYKVKGQSTPEITFGRAPGAPYTHVQLKPMTVSSRQAKLTYLNAKWVLTNFATTESNPTRHNSIELPVDGQADVKDGDRIEMGEVAFVYRAS